MDDTFKPVTSTQMMSQVVIQNDEWVVFKVNNAAEVYKLVHGLVHWCIVIDHNDSDSEDNQYWFDYHSQNGKLTTYIARRTKTHLKQDNNNCVCIMFNDIDMEVTNANNEIIQFGDLSNFPLKLNHFKK